MRKTPAPVRLWLAVLAVVAASAVLSMSQNHPASGRLTLPERGALLIHEEVHLEPASRRVLVFAESGVDTLTVASGVPVSLAADQKLAIIRTGDFVARADIGALGEGRPRWTEAFEIPEDYLTRLEGAPGAAGPVVRVQPVFTSDDRMKYNPETEDFHGELRIFLLDSSGATRSRDLDEPVSMEIESSADTVKPATVTIGRTNLPATRVRLVDDSPRDSIRVRFITPAKPDGYEVYLAVEPALVIEAGRDRMQGWGMQSIPITVLVRGATLTDSIRVRMQASLGSFDPEEVVVRSGRPASTRLRSESLGTSTISAIHDDFARVDAGIEYTPPFAFLVSAVLGGLAGGALAHLRRRKKRGRGLGATLGFGVLWGVIAALAYGILGVNLVGVDVPVVQHFNEGLVFVLSALAAVVAQGGVPKGSPATPAGT